MSIFRHGPWHRWFAWHPVNTFTHGWRWLCVVERRRWVADVPGAPDGWDYRPVSRTMSDPITKHEEAVSLLHSRGLTDKEIAAVFSAARNAEHSCGLERKAGQ